MQLHSTTTTQSLPERLEFPFSNDEILCGYEDIVSSGTDQFTAWVKVSPQEVLVHHMVDIQRAIADFREASERKPATSSQTNRVSKDLSNRSPVQKRLSIYNWNPGPQRGKEDAFEKQIAGRWHVITLQEASGRTVARLLGKDILELGREQCALIWPWCTSHVLRPVTR